MEYLPLILSVTLINLLAAMSPGPDFVMCVKNSVTYSRKIGIFTGIGIGLGLSIHITYCMAGVGLIISKSHFIFNIIKISGAIYLIYMGIKSFLAKRSKVNVEENQKIKNLSAWGAIKSGFLTNILNPKATLFFLALFSMVIGPQVPGTVKIIISLIMILTAIIWFTIVAFLFSHSWVRTKFLRFEKAINALFGGLLITLGIIAITRKMS
jgi:RhtB (resistance to homoserine/threonine) family protein